MAVTAQLIWYDDRTQQRASVVLGHDPIAVPATSLILSITGASRARLDGQLLRPLVGETVITQLNLERSEGYHRLDVGEQTYWFASQGVKLRLDEIAELLRDLGSLGQAWSGQLMFSDGGLLRDPQVVYSWLSENADEALATAEAINAQPLRGSIARRRVERTVARPIDVAATLRLLRSRPKEYLESNAAGVITVADEQYMPNVVVTKRREPSLRTVWNWRHLVVVDAMARLAEEVAAAAPPPAVRRQSDDWRERARRVAAHPAARAMGHPSSPQALLVSPSTPTELSDRRYSRSFATFRSLSQTLGWLAADRPLPITSYIAYADQIFQVWVGVQIAQAMGLSSTSSKLLAAQPAFTDGTYDLYLDCVPRADVLRSWRHHSSAGIEQDALRPDVLLHHRQSGRVALLDAKYRLHGDRATESSRKEVLSYMAAYGLEQAAIAYPASWSTGAPHVIAGARQRLVELPMRPGHLPSAAELAATLQSCLTWGRY